MSFKKLNIDRSLIDSTIKEFIGVDTDYEVTQKSDILYSHTFLKSGSPKAMLNVYYNTDGSTTLTYKVGGNRDYSLSIAQELKEKCCLKVFKSNSFYLKSMRVEDFEVLIEFLVEGGASIIEDTTLKNGRLIKLKGVQGDELALNHYSNNAFQAQGKPMLLFLETISMLCELFPFKEIIEAQLAFYDVNLTSTDIIGELENRLPISGNHLADKIKSVLSPSLALRKIDVELTDYSVFAFPILRGLEGVMKQIFLNKGVNITTRDSFGTYFDNSGINVKFTKKAKEDIKCIKHERSLCKLYSYFNIQRNSIFHMDGMVVTSKVLDRAEALHIIETGLNIIEDSYSILLA